MQSLTGWGKGKFHFFILPSRTPPVAQVSIGSLKTTELPSYGLYLGEETETWGCPSSLSGIMAGWWKALLVPFVHTQAVCHVTTWSSQKGKPSSPLAITSSWEDDCLDFLPSLVWPLILQISVQSWVGWAKPGLQSRRGGGSLLLFLCDFILVI